MNKILQAGILVLLVAGVAEVATQRTGQADGRTAIAHGESLFRTKGCMTCHTHSGFEQPQDWEASFGPDLTNYRNDPAFLRRWLDQPSAVRADTRMPDLELAPSDIEDLIAFLNHPSD